MTLAKKLYEVLPYTYECPISGGCDEGKTCCCIECEKSIRYGTGNCKTHCSHAEIVNGKHYPCISYYGKLIR